MPPNLPRALRKGAVSSSFFFFFLELFKRADVVALFYFIRKIITFQFSEAGNEGFICYIHVIEILFPHSTYQL